MGMNDKHNYDPTKWVDNSEPDIDAEHLNKIESALQEYGVSIDELAAAGGTAAKVKATDTYGMVVEALGESTAQALIDAIANKVMNELINKNKIVNNLLATDASTVLAGTQGAALDKRLVATENAVTKLNSEASTHLKESGSENSFCAAFQSRYQYNTNANYMLANGIYKTGKTGLNLPFESYWIIITFNTSNNLGNSSTAWITQFAISTDWGDKAIYFRRNINYTPTTWESWNRLVAS